MLQFFKRYCTFEKNYNVDIMPDHLILNTFTNECRPFTKYAPNERTSLYSDIPSHIYLNTNGLFCVK